MSELVKDLLNILTKEVIRCGDSVETRKTEAYFLANRLTELGYVKVVRCGECKHLEERTIAEFDKEHHCKTMYICKSPHSHMKGVARFDGDYYCSEGEAKEDTHDAV